MASPPPSIDPVSAIVAVLTAFLSPAVAHMMGTYSIIFIAAAFGAGWALMRRESGTLLGAISFVILITGTATLVTAGVTELLNSYLQLGSINFLLAPVALIIGGIGHDWPRVLPWLATYTADFITRNRKDGSQ